MMHMTIDMKEYGIWIFHILLFLDILLVKILKTIRSTRYIAIPYLMYSGARLFIFGVLVVVYLILSKTKRRLLFVFLVVDILAVCYCTATLHADCCSHIIVMIGIMATQLFAERKKG